MVNFVPAVAYHFCLPLPAAVTQPGDHLLTEPCTYSCSWIFLLIRICILHLPLPARLADRRKLYRSLQNLAAVANATVILVPLHDIEPAYFKIYLAHVVKYLG